MKNIYAAKLITTSGVGHKKITLQEIDSIFNSDIIINNGCSGGLKVGINVRILLKIIQYLNPLSIFKNVKKYLENNARINADLIDKQKQREHEKYLQQSKLQHEALENEKDRMLERELAEEQTKRLNLILKNQLMINREKYYQKYGNSPISQLERKRKSIKTKKTK